MMMRFLIVVYLSLHFSPPGSTFVGGFLADTAASSALISSSVVVGRYHHSSALEGDSDTCRCSPSPPEDDIGPRELLSQAYTTLTSTHLRDLLRTNGAKLTGNKRQLVDRLGEILIRGVVVPETYNIRSTDLPDGGGKRRTLLDSYGRLTLGELKYLLRQRGESVSGNKRELVHRLMNSGRKSVDASQSPSHNSDSRPKSLVDTNTEGWSVLEPTISFVRGTIAATGASKMPPRSMKYDIELPLLHGLLFVNKPSGYSTLPTKQQLDNPTCPVYPCLSDSVKEWLRTDPKGRQRMEEALEYEERWWEYVLRTTSKDSKQRRLLKLKKEEQAAKISTFEPRPVHRLDIDTSGIVCIALTPYALRAANMMFEKKSRQEVGNVDALESTGEIGLVHKSYLALVEGTFDREEVSTAGIIEHAIGKVWIEDHNEWACDISNDGSTAFIRPGDSPVFSFVPGTLRGAVTSYRTLDSISDEDAMDATRVELTPHTGRGHQLRLHMASIGHPIVGDLVRVGPLRIQSQLRMYVYFSGAIYFGCILKFSYLLYQHSIFRCMERLYDLQKRHIQADADYVFMPQSFLLMHGAFLQMDHLKSSKSADSLSSQSLRFDYL
jgi:23S rRNA-/tRNA-specific pseudouridylate synthase